MAELPVDAWNTRALDKIAVQPVDCGGSGGAGGQQRAPAPAQGLQTARRHRTPTLSNLAAIRSALEVAGVEVIAENGGGRACG